MKLMNLLRMVIFLTTITLLSSVSYADDNNLFDEHFLYLGPQIGVFNAIDSDQASSMGGLSARVKFGELFGAEASINYRQEKYLNNSLTVKNWPIMFTGLIYPIPYVYGAIGAGWYNVSYSYNNELIGLNLTTDTQNEFGWHFGGGVEIPLGSRIKVVGDLRYVFLNYDIQGFPENDNINADYYVFMVGVLFGL